MKNKVLIKSLIEELWIIKDSCIVHKLDIKENRWCFHDWYDDEIINLLEYIEDRCRIMLFSLDKIEKTLDKQK